MERGVHKTGEGSLEPVVHREEDTDQEKAPYSLVYRGGGHGPGEGSLQPGVHREEDTDQEKVPYSLVYRGVHRPGEVTDTEAVLLPWLGSSGVEMKQTSGFGPDCMKNTKKQHQHTKGLRAC